MAGEGARAAQVGVTNATQAAGSCLDGWFGLAA